MNQSQIVRFFWLTFRRRFNKRGFCLTFFAKCGILNVWGHTWNGRRFENSFASAPTAEFTTVGRWLLWWISTSLSTTCWKFAVFCWISLWVDKGNVKRLKRVEKGGIELEGVKSGENAWCFGWNEIESEKWTKIEVSKKSLGKWGCPLFSGRFRFGV